MHDEDDLDLTDLAQRRWVRFDLPVLVCVDTDTAGDQHVRHIVPILDDIELAVDDQHEPVVYDPNGTQRVPDRRTDDATWQAISHAGATKDTWIGAKPYDDWDWLEHPEDLTAEERDAKEEARETRRRRRRTGVDSDAVSCSSSKSNSSNRPTCNPHAVP